MSSEKKNNDYLLEVEHLKQYFPVHQGFSTIPLKAVDDISFAIRPGETLGLVGESGCGKTTVGRTLLRLYQPTAGKITFDGKVLFDSGEQYDELMKAGHIPENLLDYEETPGASEVINKWVDEGDEVFVVTGRPFDSYEPSRRWLDEHHLNRIPIYFVDKYGREMFKQDHTYNLTLEELYCMHFDFAIEDSPAAFEHVQHFKDCKVAVYDRPWNKQVEFPDESFVRCLDWKEIDRLWQQQVAFQIADLSI